MRVERWQRIERIFNATLELPSEERKPFVKENCGDDSDLYHEIIHLISESEKTDDFLSQPVFSLGAQLLDREFEKLLSTSDFGHYKLIELIGHGGIGSIFIARDKILGRQVAIKILPAVLDDTDERVLRFHQEAQLASAISHPNIAHIYEFNSHKGYYYLAMEYIRGETLRKFLKQYHPNLPLSLSLVSQIAGALNAAHRAGIIHRDIKPENIMVTNDHRTVKVLDFGLAKQTPPIDGPGLSPRHYGSNLITTPGLIIGTAAYMSPEQASGKPVDERTDIWSFGVLFYEMLTGIHPFLQDTNIETLHCVLNEEPIDHDCLAKDFPPIVYRTIMKCLAKDCDERFQTSTELVKALDEISEKCLGRITYPY